MAGLDQLDRVGNGTVNLVNAAGLADAPPQRQGHPAAPVLFSRPLVFEGAGARPSPPGPISQAAGFRHAAATPPLGQGAPADHERCGHGTAHGPGLAEHTDAAATKATCA